MRKLIATLLVFVLSFSMVSVAIAAPASTNANTGPGVAQVALEEVTVRIGGNGNSARLIAYVDGVQAYLSATRPANNATTTLRFDGFVVAVNVRGNSIISVNVVERPASDETTEPYVVRRYYYNRFVDLNQIESRYVDTTEVDGSRNLVGLSVVSTFEEVNFSHRIDNATGSGVAAGFIATGTLDYELESNYVEQFERIYVVVDVTVYSDGERVEVVRVGSEHVNGTQDGAAYSTDPVPSSRPISVGGGELLLTRGSSDNGAGQGFPREGTVTEGGFTVTLYLANQRPTVNVTASSYDINVL